MPGGRPSDYTPEVAAIICERIADGESLRQICEEPGMPNRSTVRQWLAVHPEFHAQYARAREEQGDAYAERAIHEALTASDAQMGRLRMDALKWAAGKLAPKRYGDKVQQEVSGPNGGPMETVIRWATTDEEASPDPSERS